MSTRIITVNNTYDLSEVNNATSLKEEIALLKVALKEQEKDIEKYIKKMPQQLVKSTADNLLPSFLNKLIANGTWKLLLSGASMFANPFSGKLSFKKNILGAAKKLGVMALIRGAYTAWTNKKSGAAKPAGILKSAVTSLKTKNFKRN